MLALASRQAAVTRQKNRAALLRKCLATGNGFSIAVSEYARAWSDMFFYTAHGTQNLPVCAAQMPISAALLG
jgi:hypothetical protein